MIYVKTKPRRAKRKRRAPKPEPKLPKPTICLACGTAPVKFPAVVCNACANTSAGRYVMRWFAKRWQQQTRRPFGFEWRSVQGGLPSVGKRHS
jgi:hypothetical protein